MTIRVDRDANLQDVTLSTKGKLVALLYAGLPLPEDEIKPGDNCIISGSSGVIVGTVVGFDNSGPLRYATLQMWNGEIRRYELLSDEVMILSEKVSEGDLNETFVNVVKALVEQFNAVDSELDMLRVDLCNEGVLPWSDGEYRRTLPPKQ